MLNKKAKGDLAELKVATDLVSRGYKIALPYGEDWNFDLIVCRDGETLERVQGELRALGRQQGMRQNTLALAYEREGATHQALYE